MKTTPRSEDDAQKVEKARRQLLPVGWRDARLLEAVDRKAKSSGNDIIATRFGVSDADGNERELPLYLNNSTLGAVVLRHAALACGCMAQYDAEELSGSDFPVGHPVRVKIGIQKKSRSVPFDRNVIEDIGPVAESSSVVNLRSA
jgi:hypothetical protein